MHRLFFLLAVLLVSCSAPEGSSGFGNARVVSECIKDAAPWRLVSAGWSTLPSVAGAARPLVAVTYNVHAGLGLSWALYRSRPVVEANLRGIAQSIADADAGRAPDVVALNEVDFASRRSGGFDQARFIADELRRQTGEHYTVVAGETWRRRVPGIEVRFGNAVLVRHPILGQGACLYDDAGKCAPVSAVESLPALRAKGLFNGLVRESRGLVKLTINFQGQPLDIVGTHLDAFVLGDREAQAAHILRRFVHPGRATLVLGDINAVPTLLTRGRTYFAADRTHDILTSGPLADARILYAAQRGITDLQQWATYPADAPRWPLDAVLGSLNLVPQRVVAIGATHSDHRGLAVHYRLTADPQQIMAQRALHDAIRRQQFAQILRCDLAAPGPQYAAQVRWLIAGTGFLEIASLAERRRLLQIGVPPL